MENLTNVMTMQLAMTMMEVINVSVIKVLEAMDSTALVWIGMIHIYIHNLLCTISMS